MQAIRDIDLFLVARNVAKLPVQKHTLPWIPKDGSVDPGIVTHREYIDILKCLETE